MTNAIVLLSVDANETHRIAESVASIKGVSEVYSVAGTYDLVAIIRVSNNEDLAEIVTARIRGVNGIRGS
jgi:DNA-binding Lrp family transcriptional regulator